MALSKKGKKNKAARVAVKRQEKRKKQEAKAEERQADRVARGLPAVAPKPPKKQTTWSGQDAPLPPPQLVDAIHEWLRDYNYIKAAHGMRTDNQKRPGHNMMLWKGTAKGLPQLNDIFMQWKDQNPELAKSDHERANEGKTVGEDDATSSDSDDDSSSDSDSDSSEDSESADGVAPSVPTISAGMKRKADDMSDASSSSEDSDSDLDTSDSDSDSDSDSSSDSADDTTEANKDATLANGASDSSTTVGRASLEPAPGVGAAVGSGNAAETSDESSSSDSESDSESDSDSSSDSSSDSEAENEADAKAASSASSSSSSDSSSSDSSSSSSSSSSATPRAKKPAPNSTITSESTLAANGAPATKRTRPDPQSAPVANKPFSRIADDVEVDPRFSSNAYVAYDYADRAHADLSVVRGKGFTKEKNKKKRGQGFRGGAIDMTSRAVKFDD